MNSLLNAENSLRAFHSKYGHFESDKPTIEIPHEVKVLRWRLISEEVRETMIAMGFYLDSQGDLNLDPTNQNLIEIADGIADSIYVLVGTAISYGIPIDRIFREVHRSNMTKTAVKAENGNKYGTKTPKGPDYIPPDVEGILSRPHEPTKLEMMHAEASVGIDNAIAVE